jgi:hypothetical protein
MKRIILTVFPLFALASLYAQDGRIIPIREKAAPPQQKEQFHLYLLIGQSNMAGRGIVEPQDTIGDARILRLNRNGEWEIAREPVQYDKPSAGTGPGLSFAKEMIASNSEIYIGLIPCAQGGSSIDHWKKGAFYQSASPSHPFDDALEQTRRAMHDGVIKGILWHQGESDSDPDKAAAYKEKLVTLVARLREELKTPELPFIAGEIPYYQSRSIYINPVFYEAKKEISHYDVVSSRGLSFLPDSLHLDARSQREMGKRYAEKMKELSSLSQ